MRLRLRVALPAALLAVCLPASAQAPAGTFAYERPVVAAEPGPRRLPVDGSLLAGGGPFRVIQRSGRLVADGGLADLRIFDSGGRTVPYLLVHPPAADPRWVGGRVLATRPTTRSSGFEVDFGAAQSIDAVSVAGIPAPFLKRLTLEGSGDRSRWTMLAGEATVFDLPAEKLRQTTIDFERGDYRYVRVTWNDANSGRVPLPASVQARTASDRPRAVQPPVEAPFERQASEPGKSRYRIRLPAARFPAVAVELEVGGGHVFRPATVTEPRFSNGEAIPAQLGSATLSRVVRGGVQASDLRVPISAPSEAELQLVIDDGSNPPLDVTRVLVRVAELPWIYFEGPGGELVARYGDPALQSPSYDLEAIRPTLDLVRVAEARWGDPRRLTGRGAGTPPPNTGPPPGGVLPAEAFRHLRTVRNEGHGLSVLQLDADVLANSRGPGGRFSDVRLLDESSRQIPYLLERRDEPLQVDLRLEAATPRAEELTGQAARKLSIYRLRLPEARLPSATVALESTARVFERGVRVGVERPADRRRRDPWFEALAARTWRHADQQTAPPSLSVPIESVDTADLLVVIDEGDNAPLPIASARLLLPSYRLRYFHPAAGTVRLAYGKDDLDAPRYDLALLAQQLMGAPAHAAGADADAANGDGPAEPFVPPAVFWTLLAGAVVVIAGLIVRLVRQ